MAYLFFGEPVGFDGATPPLGNSNVIFATDANHALALADYQSLMLYVTSGVALTATRALTGAPLVRGVFCLVNNETSGGQSITIGGASGRVATIPSGTTLAVICDGANYDALPASLTSSGFIPINAIGTIWIPPGTTGFQMESEALQVQTTSATPVTLGTIVVPTGQCLRVDVSYKTSAVGAGSDCLANDHTLLLTNSSGTNAAVAAASNGTAIGTATGLTWPGMTTSVSGNSVTLSLTGAASTTIEWNATLDITFGD